MTAGESVPGATRPWPLMKSAYSRGSRQDYMRAPVTGDDNESDADQHEHMPSEASTRSQHNTLGQDILVGGVNSMPKQHYGLAALDQQQNEQLDASMEMGISDRTDSFASAVE